MILRRTGSLPCRERRALGVKIPAVALDNGSSFRQLIISNPWRRAGEFHLGQPESASVATKALMGLKRIPASGFQPSATHGELGPVQVRKFIVAPRAGAGVGRGPKPLPALSGLTKARRKTGQGGSSSPNSPS